MFPEVLSNLAEHLGKESASAVYRIKRHLSEVLQDTTEDLTASEFFLSPPSPTA